MGSGFRVLGFRRRGSGFRVLGFRVRGSGFSPKPNRYMGQLGCFFGFFWWFAVSGFTEEFSPCQASFLESQSGSPDPNMQSLKKGYKGMQQEDDEEEEAQGVYCNIHQRGKPPQNSSVAPSQQLCAVKVPATASWRQATALPIPVSEGRAPNAPSSRNAISSHILSYRIVSYHIISYHILSYHSSNISIVLVSFSFMT